MIRNCLNSVDNYPLLVLYLLISVVLIFALYHGIYMLAILYAYRYRPLRKETFDKIKSYGNWVVITGTTDGIGKSFAEKLAQRKFNLFLISRNEEKLRNQSLELMAKYEISVKYVVADFTKTKIYNDIEKELVGIPVGLLINNVGVAYPSPDFINADHLTNRDFVDMLHCNCLSTVLMTRILLKVRMLDHGGVIINMSSGSSYIDTPVLSMYASCKSLINTFSSCIQNEIIAQKLKDRVFIQNISPFWIISKLSGIKNRQFLVPRADEFVDSCFKQLCRNHHSFGYITHCYENWYLNKFLPKCLRNIIVCQEMLRLRNLAANKRAKSKMQ